MPKQLFVDFKAVKAAVRMERVLEHYSLLDSFKRGADSLSGCCPIHKGDNPTQFRVSISKNIWNCFGKCKDGGNVLDFIAAMENVSIHAAALRAIEWFDLDPDAMSSDSSKEDKEQNENGTPAPQSDASKSPETPETVLPNKPLKFRLEKLERQHPYLIERGLSLETIIDFGIGFCSKGLMAGRIAIPIHNSEAEVVAYAGRFPGTPPEGTPKYKLPQGFRKSLELFNIDRALEEPSDSPLAIVEGFFDSMFLHQRGCRKNVGLMGSTLSAAQEELLRRHKDKFSHIILLLDENEAGRAGRDEIAPRLAAFAFVKIHIFGREDQEPEHLSAEELAAALA